jgi:multiple sugar transport system substrate-binding protein
MKKNLALFLLPAMCACLALVLLSSCGKGAANGVTTIKFASWAIRGDATTSEDYITLFEKKYPNIKIDYQAITEGSYSEKLNAMIAAGTAPDVILAWECDIGRFAKNKAIVPLDDYVRKTKAFTVDDFVPALKQLGSVTGATYGLPWCMAAEIAYYNKDMFDKARVPYPKDDWTWQDFEDAAKKLTIVKNGKTTQWGADALSFQGLWYSTIGATGENIIDDKADLILGDGAKTALQWQYDLTNKYKVSPPPAPSGTNAVDLFSAGKAAMTRTGNWMIGTYKGIKDFNWDIVPLPRKDRAYTTLHTGLYTINAKSKVKDAAWKFIEFALSDEGQAQIGKNSSNPSGRQSITAKGYYRSGGTTGPTNWGAIDKSVGFGQFGYVMANPGVTNKAVSDFNAVMMGQYKIDDAINDANQESKRAAAQ